MNTDLAQEDFEITNAQACTVYLLPTLYKDRV